MADLSRGSIGDVADIDVEAEDESVRPEEPDLDIQDFLVNVNWSLIKIFIIIRKTLTR